MCVSPWESPGKNTGVDILPDPGIEPGWPALQADSLPAEPPGKLHSLDITKPNNLPKHWPAPSTPAATTGG